MVQHPFFLTHPQKIIPFLFSSKHTIVFHKLLLLLLLLGLLRARPAHIRYHVHIPVVHVGSRRRVTTAAATDSPRFFFNNGLIRRHAALPRVVVGPERGPETVRERHHEQGLGIADKFVDVAFAGDLLHDALLVVVAERAGELVVVHGGAVLLHAPSTRHLWLG